MSTASTTSPERTLPSPSTDLGAKLVALAGVGLVGYGLMFLVRNFNGFIELGLTAESIGGTPSRSRPSARTSTLHQSPAGGRGRLHHCPRGGRHRPGLAGSNRTAWAMYAFLAPVMESHSHSRSTMSTVSRPWGTSAHLPGAGILLVGTLLAWKAMANA